MHQILDLPEPICDFDAGSVVVISPHMDDEVIGCGGTMLRHLSAGSSVTSVFMTDGSVGRPTVAEPTVRHDEARAVAKFLGTAAPRFLDAPDARLVVDDLLTRTLADHLNELRPQVLYVPWHGDAHRDHVVTNQLLTTAAGKLAFDTSNLTVRSYEVWSPLPASRLVDISQQMNRKLLALQMYQSQFVAHDPGPLVGLNRYRSMLATNGATHVECFDEMTWATYVARQSAGGTTMVAS